MQQSYGEAFAEVVSRSVIPRRTGLGDHGKQLLHTHHPLQHTHYTTIHTQKCCEVVFFCLEESRVVYAQTIFSLWAKEQQPAHIVQKMCNIIGDARLFQL